MKQLSILMIGALAAMGNGQTHAAPKPAKPFVNSLGMKFVPVPGTKVQFCIWETRVKDYAAYATANKGVGGEWKNPGFKQIDTHPVEMVSWNDGQTFCAWLTLKELKLGTIKAGQRYRLPTDAEWSLAVGLGKEKGNTPKAKHLGIEGVYPWGKVWPMPKGAGNYGAKLKVDGFEYTAPVGSFAANALGIHDLGGNVWEWCEDWDDPSVKEFRVLRGGGWGPDWHSSLMSSYRHGATQHGRYNLLGIGFRCVLTSD